MVAGVGHIVDAAVVSQIEVVGSGRIFGGKRVDLLYHRLNAKPYTMTAHGKRSLLGMLGEHILKHGPAYLEIAEALLLGYAYKFFGHGVEAVVCLQLAGGVHKVAELVEEPAVNLGKLVQAVDGISFGKSLGYDEYATVGRRCERRLDVGYLHIAVAGKAVHALAYHTQALLDCLFKGTSYSHYLAHRLHRRTDVAVNAVEFAKVPAGNLHHHIVERRLEECRRALGHIVAKVEKTVAKGKFGCHESQRISGGLGGESRRAAQTGVHLYHAVVHRLGVVGILHVTFAHNADMAYNLYGKRTEIVVVVVRECLGGSHDDTFAGMDSEGVEVLHVADRDTVVETVAHHFVFHFLPALERLFNKHLRRERECFLHECFEFRVIVTEAAAEAAEGVSSTHNHGIAERAGHTQRFLDRIHSLAADSLYVNLIELFNKQLAVFRIHDGLHGSAEHFHAIALKHAAAIQLHAAVEGCLAAEGEQNSVGTLFLDNALDKEGCHGQEVGLVGHSFGSLHRGDVRIDQYGGCTLLTQSFEGLGA